MLNNWVTTGLNFGKKAKDLVFGFISSLYLFGRFPFFSSSLIPSGHLEVSFYWFFTASSQKLFSKNLGERWHFTLSELYFGSVLVCGGLLGA